MATLLRALPSSRISYNVYQRSSGRYLRYHSTEIPKPPPPARQPEVETFSSTSRPRPYQAKHPQVRELPLIKKRWPILLAVALVGVGGWGAFMAYVTNKEKISSSVVRQIMRSVRDDEQLKHVLGDVIRPQPEWWLNGDPMINGRISQLQGNVDVSFRIRGTKGAGTLYFTSIRKDKGLPFTILRFKIICDNGKVIYVDAAPA